MEKLFLFKGKRKSYLMFFCRFKHHLGFGLKKVNVKQDCELKSETIL